MEVDLGVVEQVGCILVQVYHMLAEADRMAMQSAVMGMVSEIVGMVKAHRMQSVAEVGMGNVCLVEGGLRHPGMLGTGCQP